MNTIKTVQSLREVCREEEREMYLLNEIKRKKIIDNGSEGFLTKEEIKWLIEQAEKVEELKKINRELNMEIGKYSSLLLGMADDNNTITKKLEQLAGKMLGA